MTLKLPETSTYVFEAFLYLAVDPFQYSSVSRLMGVVGQNGVPCRKIFWLITIHDGHGH